MLNSRRSCGLLPHIREDVSGMNYGAGQVMGWEIIKFNIKNLWPKSSGSGVKVAVIDTGCDLDHPDLKGSLIKGKNFVEKNQDPMDRNGHGSHVAGTIAADNNGYGMVGIAPDAKIIPVKSLGDNGSGDINNVIDGILWSVDNGADIITMSLGSQFSSARLLQAVRYADSKGCCVFCAAGNSGPSVDIMYPAKYAQTISIGAIDRNLNRTSFSCSGNSLDFLAPGQDIFSCVPGGYAMMSGTSMSNPFVAGYAALYLSHKRKYNKNIKLKTTDYIKHFKKSVLHLKNPDYANQKRYEGYGIVVPKL
jgi:subtilisin family serine protease